MDERTLDGRSLARLFRAAPITALLGWELRVCEAGTAEVALPHRAQFEQGLGVTHGGIVATVADTAGFFAAASLVGSGLATVEFKVNLVAPVRQQTVVARAQVVHRGRRLVVCQASVTSEGNGVVALAQGTYTIIETDASSVR